MMNNNRCVMCNEVIPEGQQVCHICTISNTRKADFPSLKHTLWNIVGKEGIEITNQNIDWLLERVFKEI